MDNDYGLIRNIYLGVINQPGYRLAVSALLTLYIMFTALSYLAGNEYSILKTVYFCL